MVLKSWPTCITITIPPLPPYCTAVGTSSVHIPTTIDGLGGRAIHTIDSGSSAIRDVAIQKHLVVDFASEYAMTIHE